MQNKYTISVIICSALFIFNTRTNPAHFLWRHRILHDWTGLKHSQLLEISGTTPRLSVYLTCSAGSCSCVCVRAQASSRLCPTTSSQSMQVARHACRQAVPAVTTVQLQATQATSHAS